MKKILCRIVDVILNVDDYGERFFDSLILPKIGDDVIVEREDSYPFVPGWVDGESNLPSKQCEYPTDKNGNRSGRVIYYTKFQQIEQL